MRLLVIAIVLSSSVLLQGCLPLAATGIAGGALMFDDRRTSGIYVEDENIEWKARARLRERVKDVHIDVTSYNLTVLLTGAVPSEEMKNEAGEAVRAVPSVKTVANELMVAGNASIASHGNDALITSSVKARFLGNRTFSPNHVKVITEAGVVYLMGLVTQAEGDAAAEVARNTSGVSRVVKVFEYIQPRS